MSEKLTYNVLNYHIFCQPDKSDDLVQMLIERIIKDCLITDMQVETTNIALDGPRVCFNIYSEFD